MHLLAASRRQRGGDLRLHRRNAQRHAVRECLPGLRGRGRPWRRRRRRRLALVALAEVALPLKAAEAEDGLGLVCEIRRVRRQRRGRSEGFVLELLEVRRQPPQLRHEAALGVAGVAEGREELSLHVQAKRQRPLVRHRGGAPQASSQGARELRNADGAVLRRCVGAEAAAQAGGPLVRQARLEALAVSARLGEVGSQAVGIAGGLHALVRQVRLEALAVSPRLGEVGSQAVGVAGGLHALVAELLAVAVRGGEFALHRAAFGRQRDLLVPERGLDVVQVRDLLRQLLVLRAQVLLPSEGLHGQVGFIQLPLQLRQQGFCRVHLCKPLGEALLHRRLRVPGELEVKPGRGELVAQPRDRLPSFIMFKF
mmetsp:Transcript_77486/g.250795  ORF Transcript_77486/g.250795 Transcript_77486/m.250795 type:complete len:368 (+) Transcript_77486:1400-2503(+)